MANFNSERLRQGRVGGEARLGEHYIRSRLGRQEKQNQQRLTGSRHHLYVVGRDSLQCRDSRAQRRRAGGAGVSDAGIEQRFQLIIA